MNHYQSDPIFWQRFLKCAGFYKGNLDGCFGKQSLQAAHDFEQASIQIANETGSFDERSEVQIQSLLPVAQRKARELMKAARKANFTIKIISGTRTFAEQDELFRRGRDLPGKRVTRARGGQSNHNFGLAWDIAVFSGGKHLEESPVYAEIGAVGKSLGLEWGGDWSRFPDEPHHQMVKESELKRIAARFQEGLAYI